MSSLFDSLTPEQLAALLQGSSLKDEGDLLAQQLAELQAGAMPHQQHSTPVGAALGGLAEALDTGVNGYHAAALRKDRGANMAAQRKLMGDFGALLRTPQRQGLAPEELAGYEPSLSVPPMVQGFDPTAVTPEWGMDLSQSPDPTQVTPEWGLNLSQPETPGPQASVDLTQLPKRKGRDVGAFIPFGL